MEGKEVIKFEYHGYMSEIFNELIKNKMVETKEEALRFGLLALNDKYHLID